MKLSGDNNNFIPKIEGCAAGRKDPRVPLHAPHLDVEQSVLVATDGKVLAVLPVALTPDETSGPVPAEALVAARKARQVELKALPEGVKLADGTTFARPGLEQSFPDIRRVMPIRETFDVALDAKDLLRLATVLCASRDPVVQLSFTRDEEGQIDATGAIKVRANGRAIVEDACGVIMGHRPVGTEKW